jgi:hypothetical protein
MQGGGATRMLMIAATGSVTALLGAAFFMFRLKQRLLYGLTEALAGIAVAAHRVSLERDAGLPTDTGFYFAVLTAGVYLVVRGLDNMHQGLKVENATGVRRLLDRFFPSATIDEAQKKAPAP